MESALRQLRVNPRSERIRLREVVRGANVETEHTKSVLLATKIALDHLRERPDYYVLLSRMERAPRQSGFAAFWKR